MGILSGLIDRFRGARPDVILDFVFERGLLFIELVNIGGAPAYRISVRFDRPIRGVGGEKPIAEMALFERTAFMPPGKRITTFLDISAAYFERGEPAQIEADVMFRDRGGRRYVNRIKHDLEIYRDVGYVQGPVRS